jgi:hypothetical protein
MAEAGDDARLRDLRSYSQYEYEDEFVGAVERITGRTVCAFVSGIAPANEFRPSQPPRARRVAAEIVLAM